MKTKNLVNIIALSGVLLGCNPGFYAGGNYASNKSEQNESQVYVQDNKKVWVIPLGVELTDPHYTVYPNGQKKKRIRLPDNERVKDWYNKAKTDEKYRHNLDDLIHRYGKFIMFKDDFSFNHSADDPLTIMVINNDLYLEFVFKDDKQTTNLRRQKYIEYVNGYDALAKYWQDVSNKDLREIVSLNEGVPEENVVLKIESFTVPNNSYEKQLEKYKNADKREIPPAGFRPLRRPSSNLDYTITNRKVYIKNKFGKETIPEWSKGDSRLVLVKTILNMMNYWVEE